jgi:hypothetical protein
VERIPKERHRKDKAKKFPASSKSRDDVQKKSLRKGAERRPDDSLEKI